MEVDHNRVGAGLQPARLELALDRAERIVEIGHEHAPLRVDHQHIGAGLGLEQTGAFARRAGRKIDGPQQAVLALDEHQSLALVEHVVASGHHVGAGVEQLGQDRLGDAEAAGGVLAVDHHEVEGVALAQARQLLDDRLAPGPADHIAEKQNTHDCRRSPRAGTIPEASIAEWRRAPPASWRQQAKRVSGKLRKMARPRWPSER